MRTGAGRCGQVRLGRTGFSGKVQLDNPVPLPPDWFSSMLGPLYYQVKSWSSRDDANKYLFALSFAESSFFPVPPDVLLAPMCAVRRHDAVYLASMTTLFSVLGGVAGYAIGYFAFEALLPHLQDTDFYRHYEQVKLWFDHWGSAVVFIAGFSPIPYKVFTIGAGALEQNLAIFVGASLLGRGLRFFLVALLLQWAGPRLLPVIERRIDLYGWLALAVFAALLTLSVLYH